MKLFISEKNISLLATWLVAFSCFSYPITAVIIIELGLPPSLSNLILKIIYSVLALILLYFSLRNSDGRFSKLFVPILLFLLIYSLRLIIDVSMRNIEMTGYSESYIYSYFFGATVLPSIALIFARKNLDIDSINKISGYFIITANLFLFLYFFQHGTQGLLHQLSYRSQAVLESEIGLNKAFINPISVGFFGALLNAFILSNLITIKKLPFFKRIIYYGFLVLGTVNILLGASRGPMLYFALILVFILGYYFKNEYITVRRKLQLVLLSFVVVSILIFYLIRLFKHNEIFILDRMISFIENLLNGEKEYRNYAYISAINDFIKSPIWGNQFVGTFDNFYPHNIILEILMSLGLLGITIFLIIVHQLYRSGVYIWNNKSDPRLFVTFSLGLMNLLLSLTSGSIFTAPQFWIFIILLVSIPSLSLSK